MFFVVLVVVAVVVVFVVVILCVLLLIVVTAVIIKLVTGERETPSTATTLTFYDAVTVARAWNSPKLQAHAAVSMAYLGRCWRRPSTNPLRPRLSGLIWKISPDPNPSMMIITTLRRQLNYDLLGRAL